MRENWIYIHQVAKITSLKEWKSCSTSVECVEHIKQLLENTFAISTF